LKRVKHRLNTMRVNANARQQSVSGKGFRQGSLSQRYALTTTVIYIFTVVRCSTHIY